MQIVTFIVVLALFYTCSGKKYHSPVAEVVNPPQDTVTLKVDFATDILPIMKTNCTPCHFEGGKMYDKMPFDKPKTIIEHSERILGRIKDPEDVKKIRAFVSGD